MQSNLGHSNVQAIMAVGSFNERAVLELKNAHRLLEDCQKSLLHNPLLGLFA